MSRVPRWAGVLPVCLALALPASAFAQHIQAPARVGGIVVPRAYYERIARDPAAFTLPNGLFRTDAAGVPMRAEQLGSKRMVVVPALFSDSPEPKVTSLQIQQTLFDGPSARGTLTEAYDEMSRGLFHVTGEVRPWVRTSLTRAEVVGAGNGLGDDARVGEYLIQALAANDPAVDFGAFDNDGPDGVANSGDDDGAVDAVAFEFIEVAASCGGPGIWPHLWGISPQNGGQPYLTDDLRPDGTPVRIDAYIVQSAVDCANVGIQDAGTIAHEFGHVLGLPDYYHPTADGGADGRRWVLGCWELMAAGSWGCGPHGSTTGPFGPTHMSARSLESLGWLTYVDVPQVRDTLVVLDPVESSGKALRIPLDETGREYLLVEFRTRTGFDRDLPADGVMIYHQDFMGAFRPLPSSGQPYFLSVVEHDADDGLVRNTFEGGDRGVAGDAWGVGGVASKLHGLTRPDTRAHAAGPSAVTFHSIVVEGGKATLRLSTARTPELVPPGAPLQATQVTPFERRLRVAGGYLPFTAMATLPPGVDARVEGDELVVSGSVTGGGPFSLSLKVADARGSVSRELVVPLTAGEWTVGEERLLQQFLGSSTEGLDQAERGYLDFIGNRNGRYDVGDLRAWLRSKGAAGG